MQVNYYESAKKDDGSTPVFFLRPEEGELEGIVDTTSGDVRIIPSSYEHLAMQRVGPTNVQIHYLFLEGKVYRIFIGRGNTEKGGYASLKRVIRIGSGPEDGFAQLVPTTPGLSESQVNRAIRRSLRKE